MLSRLTFVLSCLAIVARCQSNNEMPPVVSSFLGLEGHNIVLTSDPSGRLSLRCSAKGEPEPEYKWFKDGDQLKPEALEGLVLTGDHNQILEFVGTSVDKLKGYYHCEASNRLGTAKSEVIFVSDAFPEVPPAFDTTERLDFEEKPETEIVEDGASVKFKCVPKKQPGIRDADIIWTKNGQILEEFRNEQQLTIEKVSTLDIATYACNITNGYEYNYKMVYLNILNQAPIIFERPNNQTVSVGQAAIFRCTAKGYPAPTVTWTYSNQPVVNVDGLRVTPGGDLHVERVRAEHANGAFTCHAKNLHGSSEVGAWLEVVSKTTIQFGPVDKQAQVFDDVKMDCTVLWDPNYKLSVSWMKDNNVIVAVNDKFVIDKDTNALTIKNLAFADSGVYSCVASTNTGTAVDSGTLTVVGIPPKVVNKPTEMMTVVEGSDALIMCKVEGYPTPTHTWFKDIERVQISGDRYQINEDGSLIIRNMKRSDSAKYICRAENGHGQPVIVSGYVDVRSKTKIVKEPNSVTLEKGGSVLFDCAVEVDNNLQSSVVVHWYKDSQKLEPVLVSEFEAADAEAVMVTASPMELTNIINSDVIEGSAENENDDVSAPKYQLFTNRSLLISDATHEDVGNYRCHVITGVDEIELMAAIYSDQASNWFIILLVVVASLLLLIFLVACIICVRHRSKSQGRYGVKDVENGKKLNRTLTEIQYSIDDEIEDKERSPLNPSTIYGTPKTLKQISELSKGSENSLLNLTDEELSLRRGMDEDGSFRGRYLE